MARASAQYLRIFTATGVTLYRWQSFYAYRSVTWSGASWDYQQFSADGFTDGSSGDETSMSISAPVVPVVVAAFESAIREGHLIEVATYEFDDEIDDQAPQADQQLVSLITAQVVGGSAGVTRMQLQVGSALAPVGAQYPPRVFTSSIMGSGCQL